MYVHDIGLLAHLPLKKGLSKAHSSRHPVTGSSFSDPVPGHPRLRPGQFHRG